MSQDPHGQNHEQRPAGAIPSGGPLPPQLSPNGMPAAADTAQPAVPLPPHLAATQPQPPASTPQPLPPHLAGTTPIEAPAAMPAPLPPHLAGTAGAHPTAMPAAPLSPTPVAPTSPTPLAPASPIPGVPPTPVPQPTPPTPTTAATPVPTPTSSSSDALSAPSKPTTQPSSPPPDAALPPKQPRPASAPVQESRASDASRVARPAPSTTKTPSQKSPPAKVSQRKPSAPKQTAKPKPAAPSRGDAKAEAGSATNDVPTKPRARPQAATTTEEGTSKATSAQRSKLAAADQATTAAASATPQQPTATRPATAPTARHPKPSQPARKQAAPAPIVQLDVADEEDELLPEVAKRIAIDATPPWLVSMVVHLIVLITLALFALPEVIKQMHVVEVTYNEEEMGDQMLHEMEISTSDLVEPTPALAMASNPADNPFAIPPEMEIELEDFEPESETSDASVGMSLTGREKGAKRALLAAYGGTASTEDAVTLGLEWLKRYQRRDGTWSLKGPYDKGAGEENKTAATAMAMLAFQGNGHTHQQGEFSDVVTRGIKALLRMQDSDGNFFRSGPPHHRLYSQAQATIAVCELYGMTQDPQLEEPAQRAVDYAVSIQADDEQGGGGWRYEPGQQVDTSVTGWYVIALQSAKMAGLNVPQECLDKISTYLDNVTEDGSHYAYRSRELGNSRPSMTAEALLCRQILGWEHDNSDLLRGVEHVLENPIDWEQGHVYYWYYATQVTHHMGGSHWDRWNNTMRQILPSKQLKSGREKGSWDPEKDKHVYQGGRLYMTCFCIYMLEVYYRHLPIYQHHP